VDTATGEVKWEVPLGTIQDLAPVPLPIRWGTPSQGGLVFIGASMDNYLRAFDLETGKELWKGRLPAGGQATPMSYRLGENGRQFVVIAAGGHGRLGTDIGDSVVAFALPESDAGVLAQITVRTLRNVVVVTLVLSAGLLIIRFARKNWFWYVLLSIWIVGVTFVAWLASQTPPVTMATLLAAVAIAWLATLGRKRLRGR
jgi:hypothetical protein